MDTSNKPKTIATIDVNMVMPKITKTEWMQEVLADHLQCVLCGSDLVFKHQTDFIAQTVTENAHCPSCQVRNRQSAHRLQ
jgi:hypothetical protein